MFQQDGNPHHQEVAKERGKEIRGDLIDRG